MQGVGNYIASSVTSMFMTQQIQAMANYEWAMDWDAADDDYFGSAQDSEYYDAGNRQYEDEEEPDILPDHDGPTLAGVYTTPSQIRFAAVNSNHGAAPHYKMMANDAINWINTHGEGKYGNYDITFNKSLRNANGKVVRTPDGKIFRVDTVIVDLRTGKVVYGNEVGNTQSASELFKRVKNVERWTPKRLKGPGFRIRPIPLKLPPMPFRRR